MQFTCFDIKSIISTHHAILCINLPLARGEIRALFSKMNKNNSSLIYWLFTWLRGSWCIEMLKNTCNYLQNSKNHPRGDGEGVKKSLFRIKSFYHTCNWYYDFELYFKSYLVGYYNWRIFPPPKQGVDFSKASPK